MITRTLTALVASAYLALGTGCAKVPSAKDPGTISFGEEVEAAASEGVRDRLSEQDFANALRIRSLSPEYGTQYNSRLNSHDKLLFVEAEIHPLLANAYPKRFSSLEIAALAEPNGTLKENEAVWYRQQVEQCLRAAFPDADGLMKRLITASVEELSHQELASLAQGVYPAALPQIEDEEGRKQCLRKPRVFSQQVTAYEEKLQQLAAEAFKKGHISEKQKQAYQHRFSGIDLAALISTGITAEEAFAFDKGGTNPRFSGTGIVHLKKVGLNGEAHSYPERFSAPEIAYLKANKVSPEQVEEYPALSAVNVIHLIQMGIPGASAEESERYNEAYHRESHQDSFAFLRKKGITYEQLCNDFEIALTYSEEDEEKGKENLFFRMDITKYFRKSKTSPGELCSIPSRFTPYEVALLKKFDVSPEQASKAGSTASALEIIAAVKRRIPLERKPRFNVWERIALENDGMYKPAVQYDGRFAAPIIFWGGYGGPFVIPLEPEPSVVDLISTNCLPERANAYAKRFDARDVFIMCPSVPPKVANVYSERRTAEDIVKLWEGGIPPKTENKYEQVMNIPYLLRIFPEDQKMPHLPDSI